MAKKLFVLEGQISFKCRLLNMGKNIIFKNQKKSFTRKNAKSKKLQKWQKMVGCFCPGGPIFYPFSQFFENHF